MRIAKIIKAQCAETNNYYGIRIEQKIPDLWESTWAFPIKDNMGVTETYQDKAEGKFKVQERYPGCPHCHQKGTFLCKCGKVSCLNFNKRSHTCPWCGSIVNYDDLGVVDNARINAGSM